MSKRYSEIFGRYYDGEDVLYISNNTQNFKYLQSGLCQGDILDIFAGDNKIIFAYRKSNNMNKLYKKWNNREL